ncbi:MAG: TM2 domain-containing protein, partial [Clostridia bacterium]|nr:TM2 domain-containing protein [Clostridia bacterium]
MKKSAWIDFFVCLFVGFYGVHKFREKKIGWGLLYLFTGGLFTLGWLYDCAVFLYVAIHISRTENVPEEERAPIDYVMAKKIGWIVVIVWLVLLFMAGACSPTPEAEDQGMGDSSIVDQIQTDEDKAESDVNSDVSFDDVIEDDTESNENETVLPEQSEEEKESDNIEEKEESSKEEPQKQEQQPQKQETPKQETTVETHTHSFAAATCIAAKSCSCGVTEGEPLGHEWKSATCTAPKTCKTCNATEGSKA